MMSYSFITINRGYLYITSSLYGYDILYNDLLIGLNVISVVSIADNLAIAVKDRVTGMHSIAQTLEKGRPDPQLTD